MKKYILGWLKIALLEKKNVCLQTLNVISRWKIGGVWAP